MSLRLPYWGWAAAAAVAVLAVWTRFHGLLAQTPFHDEWHVLVALATESTWQSLAKFGQADRSIPVLLWLHLLKSTVGVTAATLWLPFACAGILGVVAVPVLLRRELGLRGGLALAALLAASPLLVLYSRFARPYGVCAFGAVVAGVVLADFVERPSRSKATLFVALATAVAWALPVFIPFLAGPLLLEFTRQLRAPRRHLAPIVGLALAVALSLLVLFGPALLADGQSLRHKALAGEPTLASAATGMRLLMGTEWLGWIPVLGWLAIAGGSSLYRAAPARARCLAAACATQFVAVLVARPAELERPVVFARYELAVGVVLLVAVAAGIGRMARPGLWGLVAVAGVAGFVATSSLALAATGTDNFGSMRLYHRLFVSGEELETWFHELPAPYRRAFASEPGGRSAIIEVPYNGLLRVPYPYYQRLHGREVLLGQAEALCIDEGNRELPAGTGDGIRLPRFVDLSDTSALSRSGARFLFFHSDVESEVPWVRRETRRHNRFDFVRCVAAFQKLTGRTPVITEGVAVFDLASD